MNSNETIFTNDWLLLIHEVVEYTLRKAPSLDEARTMPRSLSWLPQRTALLSCKTPSSSDSSRPTSGSMGSTGHRISAKWCRSSNLKPQGSLLKGFPDNHHLKRMSLGLPKDIFLGFVISYTVPMKTLGRWLRSTKVSRIIPISQDLNGHVFEQVVLQWYAGG